MATSRGPSSARYPVTAGTRCRTVMRVTDRASAPDAPTAVVVTDQLPPGRRTAHRKARVPEAPAADSRHRPLVLLTAKGDCQA